MPPPTDGPSPSAPLPGPRRPRKWKGTDAVDTPTAKNAARSQRLFALVFGLLILLAAIIGVLSLIDWTPPHTTFLSLTIPAYNVPKPPVPFAAVDSAGLEASFEEAGHKIKKAEADTNKARFQARLDELTGESTTDTLVVFLCAHARGDGDDVLILTADADRDLNTGVSFKAVLEAVRKCQAKHKLLIVDLMRPALDLRLGMLTDDLATRIGKLCQPRQAKDPTILLACSPGEVSLPADEVGHSAFGYYLIKGLKGAAEGFGTTSRREGTIQMRELAAYVRNRVSQWALTTGREQTQTPFLIADDSQSDFEIIRVPATTSEEGFVGHPMPKDFPEAEWKSVDEWRATPLLELAPRSFGHTYTWLANGEQRWRYGKALADLRTRDFNRVFAAARSHFDMEQKLLPNEPTISLAQLHSSTTPPKGFDDFKRSLKATAEREALKKPDPAVPFKLDEPLEKQLKEIEKEGRPWVARAILEALVDDTTLGRARFNFYWNTLEASQFLPETERWVELLALARLRRQLQTMNFDTLPQEEQTRVDQNWGKRAQKVINLEVMAERILAMPRRAAPWLRATMKQGLAAREEALYLAFSPKYVSGAQAEQALDQAAKLLATLEERCQSLNRALQTYDEALAYLPGLVDFLIAVPGSANLSGKFSAEYREAMRVVREIAAVLATTTPQASDRELASAADTIIRAGRALQQRMDDLRAAASGPALKERINQVQRDGQGQGDLVLAALLKLPWLTAAERKSIWDARVAHGETLRKRLEAQDAADAEKNRAELGEPVRGKQTYPFAAEARRAIDLQRPLLELTPNHEVAMQKIRPLVEAAEPDIASIGKELRDAWIRVVEEAKKDQATETLTRLTFQGADGFELPANSSMPAAKNRSQEVRAHRQLMSDFARVVKEDFRFDPSTRDFYDGLSIQLGGGEANLPTRFEAADVRLDTQSTQEWSLRFRWSGPARARAQIEILRNSERQFFSLEPSQPTPREEERGQYRAEATIRRADLLPKSTPPEGFIVRLVADGWSQHHRVRVALPEATVTPPSLLVSAKPLTSDAAETAVSLETLRLRPNQPQEFHLYIHNPGEVEKKLYVELLSGGRELARSGEIVVTKDQRLVEVQLAKPAMPKLQDLASEVLDLRVRESTGTRMELQLSKLKLQVMEPSEYVIVSNAVYDVADRSMKITARLRDGITGPDCPIELSLASGLRDFNQGLNADPEGGVRRGKLKPGERKAVELSQRVRQLRRQTSIEAMLFVKVDDVARALAYRTEVPSADSGLREMRMDLFREPWLGTGRLPEYSQPILLNKALRLESLNLTPKQVLRVAWDRHELGDYRSELARLQGPRRTTYQWSIGESNLLTIQANASDWELDLDFSPLGGTAFVRVEAYDGPDMRDEVFKTQPQKIILDGTEPPRPRRGSGFRLVGNQLDLRYRASDPESGIDEVKLYLGEYLGEESLPKQGARKARELGDGEWSITIPVQPNEPTMAVTVVATNRVKLSAILNDVIDLEDLRRQAAEAQLATVRGTVRGLSGTPESGVTVELWQAGKATKFSEVTNANGIFNIKRVPPGRYQLRGTKSPGNLTGQTEVFTLEAGQDFEKNFNIR